MVDHSVSSSSATLNGWFSYIGRGLNWFNFQGVLTMRNFQLSWTPSKRPSESLFNQNYEKENNIAFICIGPRWFLGFGCAKSLSVRIFFRREDITVHRWLFKRTVGLGITKSAINAKGCAKWTMSIAQNLVLVQVVYLNVHVFSLSVFLVGDSLFIWYDSYRICVE